MDVYGVSQDQVPYGILAYQRYIEIRVLVVGKLEDTGRNQHRPYTVDMFTSTKERKTKQRLPGEVSAAPCFSPSKPLTPKTKSMP